MSTTTMTRTRGGRTVLRIAGYHCRDIARSRWLTGYALTLGVITWSLLQFGGAGDRALLSLLNIVLFVVPLVTIVFGTIARYNASELVSMLLAQPISRIQLYTGLYLGLAAPFVVAFVAGLVVPFLLVRGALVAASTNLVALAAVGAVLTAVFTALAAMIATRTTDRLRGLGLAIAVWLLTALVYDGLVLIVVAAFADYPIEKPMLLLSLANPIDLARIVVLLRFDVSALMGYTGAVFRSFFGGAAGIIIASTALSFWIVAPFLLGLRQFRRQDL